MEIKTTGHAPTHHLSVQIQNTDNVHRRTCPEIFIAVLLMTAKTWKQPRYTSVGKWINNIPDTTLWVNNKNPPNIPDSGIFSGLKRRDYSHAEPSLTLVPGYGLRKSSSRLGAPSTVQGIRNPKANITRKTIRLLDFILRAGGAVVTSVSLTLYTRSDGCAPTRTALSSLSCYFLSRKFRWGQWPRHPVLLALSCP